MVTLREINKDEQELAFLLSQKQDSLKVFLTCLESKNSKILLIGITCIQKLVAYQAVAPSDLEFILKAFKSDQFTTIDLQLKVLQVLSLCTLYEDGK